jgi:hypothetical protein
MPYNRLFMMAAPMQHIGVLPGEPIGQEAAHIEPAPQVMDTVLEWIGFDSQATRDRIWTKGFESLEDLATTKEKDGRDLAESYLRHTVADGRAIFGLRRIRYLIGLIHWVRDFGSVNESPTIERIKDAATFKMKLDEAFYRADVRKVEQDQADTVSKTADPGKLKDERKCPEWEPAFVNYLSTIPGVSNVPLAYVVHEEEVPKPDADYGSFNEKAIACAPLTGANSRLMPGKCINSLRGFANRNRRAVDQAFLQKAEWS